jgi:putative endonuclease
MLSLPLNSQHLPGHNDPLLMSESNWFVYIIRSDDDQLYTGITTDIARRWQEHTNGKTGARYFRGRQPRQLCFLEPHDNRSSASKREAEIKKLDRRQKNALIAAQPALPITPEPA